MTVQYSYQDKLGNEIRIGDYIAYSNGDMDLKVGQAVEYFRHRIRIKAFGVPNPQNPQKLRSIHPTHAVKIRKEDLTMFLLKTNA